MPESRARQRKPTAAEMATVGPDETPGASEDSVVGNFALDLRGEAEQIECFTVQLPGGDVEIPLPSYWTLETVDAFTATPPRIIDAFGMMGLTSDELALIRKLNGKTLSLLVEHANKVGGVGLGESEDSATTSRSTKPRSKRT